MSRHLADGAVLPAAYTGVSVATIAGFTPQPGPVAAGVLVGFEFGQMHATTLIALARYGALRATPWRMLLIEGMDAAPEIDGLIVRPSDPMLRVTACSGKPACFQALQPTRALARCLAPHLPGTATLHVSGCAKGCAQPGAADFTLTAQEAGFDFIRSGRANGAPERRALTEASLTEHPAILTEMP